MSIEAWVSDLATVVEWFAKQQAEDAVLVAAYDNLLDRHFSTSVTDEFWQFFQNENSSAEDNQNDIVLDQVMKSIDYLHSTAAAASNLVAQLPESKSTVVLSDKIHRLCRQVLLSRPKTTRRVLSVFFQQQFRRHMTRSEETEEQEENDDAEADSQLEFSGFCSKLRDLHLVELCEEVFLHVLYEAVRTRIHESCADVFDEPHLQGVQIWLENVVFTWLNTIIGQQNSSGEQWRSRLEFFAFETLALLRISELFDIIVDYPQSQPALDDLKDCLQRTKQFAEVVQSLRNSFQKRLLHPGAETSQILRIYIATIKAIRQLDPSSVLLEHACPELRAYLRQRPDTLRCIVSALTAAVTADTDGEEASGEGGDPILIEELQANDSEIQLHNPDSAANEIAEDSDDEDVTLDGDAPAEPGFLRWAPKPLTTNTSLLDSLGSEGRRPADILSLLLGIYGTKDVFVEEYERMLGEKLFAITDFNTDKQLRNVELLKLKFGESSLQRCEIMLKDMADSKRANTWILDAVPEDERDQLFPLTATVVSYLFWPEKFKSAPAVPSGGVVPSGMEAVAATAAVPKLVRENMAKFSELYIQKKASRRLEWQDHLGVVELELEFGEGETKEFTCTPQQASLIMLFDGGQKLTIDDMIEQLAMQQSIATNAQTIRKRLGFWISQGIVRKCVDASQEMYESISSLSELDGEDGGAGHDHDGGQGSGGAGGHGADDEEDNEEDEYAAAAEQFIVGMLTNLGACQLEKIHMMLTFAVAGYSLTMPQTAKVLKKMVSDERVEQTGNEFSLKK